MQADVSNRAVAYDLDFYADQAPGSERSARVVLPLVLQLLKPESLVDVGCGIGTWLRVAKEIGVATVHGLDGAYAPAAGLLIADHEFRPTDLKLPLPELGRRFDLALCLEVAEHLPIDRSPGLVDDLCVLADVVLFSAAIPCQGGTGHINLQPQSSWIERFAAKGYQAFDLVRPKVWSDSSVEAWYRQNILVFVNGNRADLVGRARELLQIAPPLVDVVHPELVAFWQRRATRPVSMSQALSLVLLAAERAVKRRLGSVRGS